MKLESWEEAAKARKAQLVEVGGENATPLETRPSPASKTPKAPTPLNVTPPPIANVAAVEAAPSPPSADPPATMIRLKRFVPPPSGEPLSPFWFGFYFSFGFMAGLLSLSIGLGIIGLVLAALRG